MDCRVNSVLSLPQEPKPDQGRSGRLLFLSALLLAFTACDVGNKPASGGRGSSSPPVRKVQTARVAERRIERSIIALGSLIAHESATLSAKVPGRVESIPVDLGSRVRRGEVLARIEPRDYELKVRQAAAALVQARAALGLPAEGDSDQVDPEQVNTVREAQAVLDEAMANLERNTKLSQDKIIAQSELDTMKSANLVALHRFQDAREKARQQQALVVQRRVEYEIAKQQLTDSTILAPFDGGIQERRATAGEYLTIGSPVVTLVRLDPLRLRVEVSEREAPKVRLGQPVHLTLEGDPHGITGEINRLSPAINEQNRMLVVEADVPNNGTLRPGSFARTAIIVSDNATVLTVVSNAIATFAGLEKAYTIEKGKAVEHRVVTGDRQGDWIEVVSGLRAGEKVVLNPGGLQAGQPVAEGP
jgi:RND family efflux transporter MFP subunit